MTLRLAALAALIAAALTTAGPASAATFVVRNTNDSGPDSLRAAILAANATDAADSIRFAIPGAAPYTITLLTPLPKIVHPLAINAQTQTGFNGAGPLVQLANGTGDGSAIGFEISAGASKILGFSITGFGNAIQLEGGDGNTVAGNWLGLDTAGQAAQNSTGIAIRGGAGNLVGGTTASQRNVISAGGLGIVISGSGATANTVKGNYIGTDANGGTAMPNEIGVVISGASTGNTVGGTSAAARNILSGNSTTGISIVGQGTKSNLVEGNYIGPDANGNPLGNRLGVFMGDGASQNTIGGSSTTARNTISANGSDGGVHIEGTATKGNVVAGNYIGIDPFGEAEQANAGNGVTLAFGAAANVIGGTAAGARNVISGNGRDGVELKDAGTHANVVEGNVVGTGSSGFGIISNGLSGIEVDSGAADNTIGGTTAGARNVVSGNSNDVGIDLVDAGTTGNVVAGNYVGTDAAGTPGSGNKFGIASDRGASGNTIGGTVAGARNVVSSNEFHQIVLGGPGGGNLVVGNYVGTDASGASAAVAPHGLSQAKFGILISESPDNTVGGTTAAARNIVVGGPTGGIAITGPGAQNNVVEGNWVGLDASVTAAPNGAGISVQGGASNNTVGGTAAGAGNVASGNSGPGIEVTGTGTQGNAVEGNLIGTNLAGAGSRPNGGSGVSITLAASGNTIGGTTPAAANTIRFNGGSGVLIDAGTGNTNGDAVERNSIFENDGLGIVLANGANDSIAEPVVKSVDTVDGQSKIVVDLGAQLAVATYRFELFSSPACDGDGGGEGKVFLGAKTIDSSQTTAALFVVPALPHHESVTATTTDLGAGDTSQFSKCAFAP